MNPSGLMAGSLFGVNGRQPRLGRHLERARPAPRDRLDHRDRIPFRTSASIPTAIPGAWTSSAPYAARTRTASGWDGRALRAAPDDQRRPRHRHHPGHAGPRPWHDRPRWGAHATRPTPASRVRGQTANRRVVALDGRYERGRFYSGTRTQTVAGVTIRALPGYIS